MDKELKKFLQDDSEDALLARIQEESLRYYNEVELPRRAAECNELNKISEFREESTKEEPKPHCSKQIDISDSPVKDVFYKGIGHGAEGFHLAAGETYIYPTNYPIRKYQKTIIQSALFHNTLVSLPTGLGKTFIGAVVMYNYYRWFPQGKIVFMAPTKPLVAQQIRACHNIMAIPIGDTIEMTGTMNPVDRLQHWKSKRVFFLTPQVMANDLRSGVCPAKLFKCVVIDEAHRATKEYSFCHVIKELEKAGAMFRVLALSATPGSNIKSVIEIVQNLRISTLELRGEDSPDVTPYTHDKQIEPVFLSLPKHVTDFLEQFLVVFERYTKNLRDSRIITCNVRNLTKFQLLKVCEKIRTRPPNGMNKARAGHLISDLMVCITLAHGLELLKTYGLRAFYHYFTGCEDEENRKGAFTRLNQDAEFHQLMSNLQNSVSSPMDQFWSHPKHEQLVKILKEHFCKAEENGTDSKVIIFCQYRVVVAEVYELLQAIHPLIKPVMFIGQGVGKDKNGLPQKKQLEVMKQFREGKSNVMIATCVAEEGLDIGSVDLLMLMEVQRSPVRLVQRLGRTGRHRQGRCVVLLTQGKEVQKFHEAMATRKSFLKNVQNSKALAAHLYKEEPTMVPPYLMPKLQLVHIKVPERITPGKPKKQSDIRQALLTKLEGDEEPLESPFLSTEQLDLVKEELNTLEFKFDKLGFTKSSYLYHRMNEPSMSLEELFQLSFCQQSEFNDWNRVSQQTYLVSHSCDAEMLCHMLNKAEKMQLGEHTDINSQMDFTTIITSKKTTRSKRANPNNEHNSKKKKVDKENNLGMDIRECMALAADKIRLTQDLYQEKCEIITVNGADDENIVITQSSTPFVPDEVKQSKNIEPIRNVDCSLCKAVFNEDMMVLKSNKCFNNQTFPIAASHITAVELLVKHLTKDMIANINVNNMFSEGTVKSERDHFKNIINDKNSIENSLDSGKTSSNKMFCKRSETSTKVSNQNLNYPDNAGNKNLQPQNMIISDKEEEFFNLEDIFNEDDDFDLLGQSSNQFLRNSTPKKEHCPIKNIGKHNSSTPDIFEVEQRSINIYDKKLSTSSNTGIQSSVNKRNVFKIPQMKLNLQISSNPLNECNNLKSPESPILSGQVTNRNNSLVKKNISNTLLSPESPILSGHISNSKNYSVSILNNPYKAMNPDSPILSGQILPYNSSRFPKLERKVLFSESEIVKEDDAPLCKPLDNAECPVPEEVDEASLLSISQLFDEDSNEENKGVNLEQSSMYTISQMVRKVSDLANNKKNTKTNDFQSKNIISNILVNFERSEEDSLFDNIDLDLATNSKQIQNSISDSNLRPLDKKTTNLDPTKICDLRSGTSAEKAPIEDRQTHEDSFIAKMWSSCMKSPYDITKIKTSTPNSFARKQPEVLSHSEIKPNVKSNKIVSCDNNNSFKRENSVRKCFAVRKIDYVNVSQNNLRNELTKVSSDISQAKQDSFVTSNWKNCLSSPFSKIKPSTPLSVVKKEQKVLSDSDSNSDVFQSPLVKKNGEPLRQRDADRKVKKKKLFLELEADVSGPPGSSDEENTSGLDELDDSFINDLTEQVGTSVNQTITDIQARYLQSVKSPLKKLRGFKIPVVSKSVLEQDVFSQEVEEDDSYENDSFCCDATEAPMNDDPSLLEVAEQILEKKKKSKKVKKKRKYKFSSESSNEDQALNSKKRLKNNRVLNSELSSDNDQSPVKQICRKRKRLLSSSDSDVSPKLNKLHKSKMPHLLTSESDSDVTL